MSERTVELEVDCTEGDSPHMHVVRISPAPLVALGGMPARKPPPGTRSIQYTCPVTGNRRLATFQPPAGFDWPYKILSVQ